MKIVSKFKDYYDTGMGYGFDDIRYIREVKAVRNYCVHRMYHGYHGGYQWEEGTDLTVVNICFCGHSYSCIRTGKSNYKRHTLGDNYIHVEGYDYYYTIEEVDAVVEKLSKRYVTKYYDEQTGRRKNLAAFLAKNGQKYGESTFNKIQEAGIPIYVGADVDDGREYNAFTNVPLKNYQFYRVKDAFTAYQEINQFLSNVAHPNKPIPTVSDRDMIVAKGFDLKTSFRKEKKDK